MRFKVDENLPIEVADLLVQAGHNASTVASEGLSGVADPGIASVCRQEERVLITLDMDFADIRTYPPGILPGIVVMRLVRQDKTSILRAFSRILPEFSQGQPSGALWIVEADRIRIREGTTEQHN